VTQHTINKSSAIRALLRNRTERNPIAFADFHQAVEKRLKQVIGRARLRKHLSVIQATEGWLRGTGRGETRRYGLVEGGR
jgi:hypothetical protein